MTKKIIIFGLLVIIALSMWTVASAGTNRPPIIPSMEGKQETLLIPTPPAGSGEQYLRNSYLPEMTKTVISAAGVSAVLFIIIGGIQILTAYGNDEQIGKGKKTITFAIIGLVISILSYAIVSIISTINLSSPPT